ncbi:7068_t:CDS:10 [Ambispora leptoticha]|uniref:7068_t:CDS:1 n=1 Tax=Ambispora leptoticha TaxID=144679 RepID=A0A9N8W575_9GLOM|nr:7068_t:CDS:10 [Ambispora leptoticha]
MSRSRKNERPAMLLIKNMQINLSSSEPGGKLGRLLFGPDTKPKLEFSIDDKRCKTTETKISRKNEASWSEHLTFELSPPVKEVLHVNCYDMSRGGDEGFFGKAELNLSSCEAKGKIPVELPLENLEKHKKSVGNVFFTIYFLSGNLPKDADLNLRDESSSNNIKGVLLLKNITCKGIGAKGHLELLLRIQDNPTEVGAQERSTRRRSQAPVTDITKKHTTEKYWNMSPEECEYPIAFSLIDKNIKLCIQYRYFSMINGFAKAELEINSAENWKTLMETGMLKCDLPLKGTDLDGHTRFNISFHTLTTFKQIIEENSQETTQAHDGESNNPNQEEGNINENSEDGPKTETKKPPSRSNSSASSEKSQPYSHSRRTSTFSSTSSTSRFSNRTNSTYRSKRTPNENYGSVKIVCSRSYILSSVEYQERKYRNRLYKGQTNYYSSDQIIIKVFEHQSLWENERKFLCRLQSKYVVKWMDMEIDRPFGGFVSITCYAGEDLEAKQHIFNDPISKKQILLSISKAIKFLHDQEIAHLDLKPSDIICKPNKDCKIRLCDFEMAKEFGNLLQFNHDDFVPGFSAPEIVQPPTIPIKVSSAQDIFSLGCIFYFIHTKKIIYESFDDLSTCVGKVRCDIFDQGAASIIVQMLDQDPINRPKIQKVIDSDYFKEDSDTYKED